MRILMIDNYDSFTYNLVQYLGELGAELEVRRNDAIDVAGVRAMAPQAIVISPGPCTPKEAGVSVPLLRAMAGELPILGVCLGHQCIGEAFGGKVVRAGRLMHGKTSPIVHDGRNIFAGLPNPFDAMRYHSLLVDADSVPSCSGGQRAHCRGRDHGACGIARSRSRASSSIPNRSARPRANGCSRIF